MALVLLAPRIIRTLFPRHRFKIVFLALDVVGDSLIQQSVFLFLIRSPLPLLLLLRNLCKLGLDVCIPSPLIQSQITDHLLLKATKPLDKIDVRAQVVFHVAEQLHGRVL